MKTMVVAERLIPGRGAPIDAGAVVWENDTIVFAGARRDAPTGDADVTVEVETVLPGLWECHGHFFGVTNTDILRADLFDDPALRGARSVRDLEATLQGGVTSVREVGGLGVALRDAIEDGAVLGPHLYPAGEALSPTAGHVDVHSVPIDWVESAAHRNARTCDGVDGCLKAVRLQLRRNASVIKICASGGVMSEVDHPMHQQFSDDELAAIVAEAARAERVVAAHCHGKAGIMAALRAGCRTIEHGTYLDEEAAELMVEKGAILVATAWVIEMLRDQLDSIPAFAREKAAATIEAHRAAMELAVAKGVTLATGTDIFVSGRGYGTNSREIGLLVEAGLDPLAAIEAATATGPLTLGPQAPNSGVLEPGRIADVIAVDFDPLDEPTSWGDPARVSHVWKAGAAVKGM